MVKTRKNRFKKGGQQISRTEVANLFNLFEDTVTKIRVIYATLDKDKYYIITNTIKIKIQQLNDLLNDIIFVFNNANVQTGRQPLEYPIKMNPISITSNKEEIIINNLNIIGTNLNTIKSSLRTNIRLIKEQYPHDIYVPQLSVLNNIIFGYKNLVTSQFSSPPPAISPAPRAATPAPRAASPAARATSPAPRARSPAAR